MALTLYCILLLYCCLWIPWRVQWQYPTDVTHLAGPYRVGYGWLWAGPDIFHGYPRGDMNTYATPDIPVILLRFLAATSIGAAAMLAAGVGTRT
jgi:hypothetical protein